jgi:hypothetical protein
MPCRIVEASNAVAFFAFLEDQFANPVRRSGCQFPINSPPHGPLREACCSDRAINMPGSVATSGFCGHFQEHCHIFSGSPSLDMSRSRDELVARIGDRRCGENATAWLNGGCWRRAI